jgi:beta-galactosidase
MPLEDISAVGHALRDRPGGEPTASAGQLAGPAFARAVFDLPEAADLYLSTAGWDKGIAWVNASAWADTGRADRSGRSTCPAPATRTGANELIILELHPASAAVTFRPGSDLGHTEL